MISEKQFKDSAKLLGVEPAVIKAVAEVESGGAGIINGLPVILFEPHVFWKQLEKRGIDPRKLVNAYGDMLYSIWSAKPYPKGQRAQYDRLDRAVKIDRDAALCSCSWGKFQIMGYHFKKCGYPTVQKFVNAMYHSEDKHLEGFAHYIQSAGLVDEMQNFTKPALLSKAAAQFARAYNGALYWKHQYDVKLVKAYLNLKT